jgi:hypothetical protein
MKRLPQVARQPHPFASSAGAESAKQKGPSVRHSVRFGEATAKVIFQGRGHFDRGLTDFTDDTDFFNSVESP